MFEPIQVMPMLVPTTISPRLVLLAATGSPFADHRGATQRRLYFPSGAG